VQQWWKVRAFAALNVPQWMRQLLGNTQPILLALQEKIDQLTLQLQNAATEEPPRGLGKMTSVIIDREIGNWHRFNNRRQIASYTGLCPGEYSSGHTRVQSCITKHGNPRLRAALVELAWRMVRFQPRYRAVRKWKERLRKGQLTTGPQAQKSHRRFGPPIGSGSVACAHRPAHTTATGISNLKTTEQKRKRGGSRGTVLLLQIGACEAHPKS